MEDKYYIIDYDYKTTYPNYLFFVRELIPVTDFDHFIRDIEHPKIELLGYDSCDGIYPYYGALLECIKIKTLIRDLNIIKGYYTNKEEAEKDLNKLINFIEKTKKK